MEIVNKLHWIPRYAGCSNPTRACHFYKWFTLIPPTSWDNKCSFITNWAPALTQAWANQVYVLHLDSMQRAIVPTGQSSLFTFMCSRIRSQVIHYFPWLTPRNRLKLFFFPAGMKGIVCDGGEAAAHLPKGRGRLWLQRHSLCTSVLPLCRGCVDLLSDVLMRRAASIWSGAWLAGCRAYRNHICTPARPATTETNSKGAGTNMKDYGNPILVWSEFWVISLLQGEFHPVWSVPLLPYA